MTSCQIQCYVDGNPTESHNKLAAGLNPPLFLSRLFVLVIITFPDLFLAYDKESYCEKFHLRYALQKPCVYPPL